MARAYKLRGCSGVLFVDLTCSPDLNIITNFIRSAKSGNAWSKNELIAYNISRKSFSPPLSNRRWTTSIPTFSLLLLAPKVRTFSTLSIAYLGYLDLAVSPTQESFMVDLTVRTLDLLGFNERGTVVVTKSPTMRFLICADSNRIAQANVCLLHRSTMVLLVLLLIQDKTLSNRTDAESQLIAEVIAAFQLNNQKRDLAGLAVMTIPCIAMGGSRPTFYLVPVTQELRNAVIGGVYPATKTRVLKCVAVAAPIRRISEGMEDTEY